MPTFNQERKNWSDQYIPEARTLLAAHFKLRYIDVQVASLKEDMLEATDFVLPKGTRIVWKHRKHDIWKRYPTEFGFRHFNNFKFTTEYEKVLSGFGDFLLYSFGAEGDQCIGYYKIIDLAVIRAAKKARWEDCVMPSLQTIPTDDVGLMVFRDDAIDPKYGQLILKQGRA